MRLFEEQAREAVKLLPGEYFASAQGEAIITLLGSCVSVCLYDKTSGVGGMNHFMLPEPPLCRVQPRCSAACPGPRADSARYGSCAMRLLIARMEELGAQRSRLQAKLFGAGRVLTGAADIGEKNASFALRYLAERGIPVVASDLRESSPRKVLFFTATGQVYVKRIRS